jgi:Reverse transcriptase (RNA-dependent DNA polymerase)
MSLGIDLLEKGYFPREVPPTFATDNFAALAAKKGLCKLVAKHKGGDPTRPIRHNLARPGELRRPLSIPNPLDYMRLSSCIENGWPEIQTLISKTTIASSSPILAAGPRAFVPRYSDAADRRALSRTGARYLLKADIQNFYPSIYTHSIPWALHTKSLAKSKQNDKSLLGNKIDIALRTGQDRQTLGIPIGPDASWLIAECLMTVVESDLSSRIQHLQGHRYIDDFELSFGSISEAESGLGHLQEALAVYELSLNPRKTRIVELPDPIEDPGIAELRRWAFRTSGVGQKNDIRAYFDRVAELITQNRGGHTASYAIARLRSADLATESWPLLEAQLLQLMVSEPSCALQVAITISTMSTQGHTPTAEAITTATERLAIRHGPLGLGSEIALALWISLSNNAKISQVSAEAISKMDDCLVALLALHANAIGLIPSGLDTGNWEKAMTAQELRGERWLLAYEASVQGWLPSVAGIDHVLDDPFFCELRDSGIRFYDTSAMSLTPTSPQAIVSGGGGGGY